MKYIVGVFLFIIVLFIYVHVCYHLKTSNDLEVYEVDNVSKERLEDICNHRQPILLDSHIGEIINNCNLQEVKKNYGAFDVNIRNVKETDDKTDLFIPFTLEGGFSLFQKDTAQKYCTENNGDFLKETGLVKTYQYNDGFFRPPMVSACVYDFLSGSKDTTTPLRYNLYNRNYFIITEGKATVKLITPDSTKYLYENKDYENYEFRSPVNPWNVQPTYRADFAKFKTLEITLEPGKILYIPPYWWYSIRYDTVGSIATLQYNTYLSVISLLPTIAVHKLQLLNVKREHIKKADLTDVEIPEESNPEQQNIDSKEPVNDNPIETSE